MKHRLELGLVNAIAGITLDVQASHRTSWTPQIFRIADVQDHVENNLGCPRSSWESLDLGLMILKDHAKASDRRDILDLELLMLIKHGRGNHTLNIQSCPPHSPSGSAIPWRSNCTRATKWWLNTEPESDIKLTTNALKCHWGINILQWCEKYTRWTRAQVK